MYVSDKQMNQYQTELNPRKLFVSLGLIHLSASVCKYNVCKTSGMRVLFDRQIFVCSRLIVN